MTDNTTLPPGGGGDTIRAIAKTATGAKVQAVALDIGGGLDSSVEAILTMGQATAAHSVPVVLASDQSAVPFAISGTLPAFAATPTFNIGTAPALTINALPAGTNAIGSITNASFGISGTLPAFAATPTFNIGTAPSLTIGTLPSLPAGANVIGAVNLDIGGTAVSATNPVYMADAYLTPSMASWTSATAANTALTSNTAGMDGVMISLVVSGTITAGTVIFEAYDGTTWLPIKVFPLNSYNSYASVNLITSLATGYQADIAGCTQFRVRLGTAITGSGTLLVTNCVTSAPLVPAVTVGMDPSQPLPAGTNMLGGVQPDAVLDAVTVSGSQSAAAVVVSSSTQGFAGGSFHITSIGTGNTITFEQSNDNANWAPLIVTGATGTGSVAGSTTASTGMVTFAATSAYVRARVSTYGSGTVTIFLTQKRVAQQVFGLSLAPGGQTIGNVTLTSGAQLAGYMGVGYVANNSNAGNVASILSPATPAGASIKALAGRVVGIMLLNSAAAMRSVKFYNATSVTMGTTAAAFEIDIPAGGTISIAPDGGFGFATGIMWAVTAGKGLSDNTSSGLAANDVSGVVLYA